MMRYKLILEYNGANLIGWQANVHGPSVQSLLINAIFKFSGQNVDIISAGRTDAGVHALGMVAHFDLNKEEPADTVMRAINFYLQQANAPVAVLDCKVAAGDFHARFSALRRNYKYIILNRRAPAILDQGMAWWMPRELDIKQMRNAAKKLIGYHDFTSFRASQCQAKSPMRTLDCIDINVQKDPFGEYVIISFSARSFLHHQVRNIVGTLVEIGLGKPYDIDEIFSARNRAAAGPTAPACGLYFVSADYATSD